MHILKLSLICCMAMIFVIGCASEKKMEQTAETEQKVMTKTDTASTKADTPAVTPAAYEEVTLNLTGVT